MKILVAPDKWWNGTLKSNKTDSLSNPFSNNYVQITEHLTTLHYTTGAFEKASLNKE
jgi:hypothetical protein